MGNIFGIVNKRERDKSRDHDFTR